MPIVYDATHRLFSLHTARSTYQLQADACGTLLHLYYGRRTGGCMDYLLTYADRGFSGNPYDVGDDRRYSLDALPQEFPVQGTGDCRSPLLIVRDAAGAYGCDLRYRSHRILPGKYRLAGLPAVYADGEDDGAETLEIRLEDPRLGLQATLLYGVLPKLDIVTRSVCIRNAGAAPFTVEKLQSACLDFVGGDYDLISFSGRHAMERQPDRRAVEHGSCQVGSRRGYSSHQYNPFVILCDRDATETAGRCWAMEFVYSGGFLAEAERDGYEQTRLQMGLSPEKFSYPLQPGESLLGPEVIMSFSACGLTPLSQNLHACLRRHVCRGYWRDRVRPILLNSWEASYFDFSGDSLLALARQARDLGVDMLVMDDGWFGSRCDDKRALGDWTANEEKLGGSLGRLVEQVRALGLRFGIWMEPEMVSEDSALYRAHPDWALALPGKPPVRSRSQLVLDLSRRDVQEYLFDALCGVLNQGEIDYLKWDANRSIEDVYSYASPDQGKVLYDYMLGLYALLERLCQRYPRLLIEGCSGGGGRFDAGMLYYSPQIWCSDNTDAMDRLRIQYGSSFGYPVSSMGSHVSACPNHQTGRSVPLATRGLVAMSGSFGFELDPAKLSEEERAQVRQQIETFRRDAPLIHKGLYYRLTDPAAAPFCAWGFVSPEGDQALLYAVLQEKHANMPALYLRPRGLTPGTLYRDADSGALYWADALMDAGLPLPLSLEERCGLCIRLERIQTP